MFESALFIVTGVAFYGGAHQLYLGTRSHTGHPHVVHALMFFLLAGFATTTALTASAQSIAEISAYGKLAVSMGMLLFCVLPWLIVLYTRQRVRVLPALLSAAWSTLLLLNLGSTSSLLYQDVNQLTQTLPSGQIAISVHTLPNPWWNLVELTMIATLIFSLHASYQCYRRGNKQLALALGTALLVLLCTTLMDLFINAGMIESAYLAPLGFLIFLVISSAFIHATAEREERQQGEQAQPSYQLTLNLNHSPSRREKTVSWPQHKDKDRTAVEQAEAAELTHQEAEMGFPLFDKNAISAVPEALPVESQQPREAIETAGSASTERGDAAGMGHERTPPTQFDNPAVDEVSDNLVDIAVHATMILNRLQRGDADLQELETLSRKVKSRAIETRRITHRMRRADRERDQRSE